MSKAKRITAILLSAAFVLSLAACGEKKDDTGKATTDAGVQTQIVTDKEGNTQIVTVTNASGKTATTNKDGKTNAKGKTTKAPTVTKKTNPKATVTVPSYKTKFSTPTVSPEYPRKASPSKEFLASLNGYQSTEVTYWGTIPKTDPIYWSSMAVEQTVESRYGVDIKQKPITTNYAAYINSSLSSGEAPGNICYARDAYFINYFNSDYLQGLDKAVATTKVDFTAPYYNQDVRKFFDIDGDLYGWAKSEGGGNQAIYYHKDMVKAAGLTDPATLASQGKWNWDTLKTYATKLKSGSRMGLTASGYTLISAMMASIGDNLVDMSGSKPSPRINTTNGKKCLNKALEFAKTGAVDIGGSSWDTGMRNWAQKKSAMIASDTTPFGYLDSKISYDIGVAPFPKGPGYTGAYRSVHEIAWITFIPVADDFSETDVAKSLFIQDEILRQSYRYWARDYWVRNQSRFKSGEDLKRGYNIENALNGYKYVTNLVTVYETKSGENGTYRICNDVIAQKKSPQQALEAYANTTQAQYDKFWGKHKITGK